MVKQGQVVAVETAEGSPRTEAYIVAMEPGVNTATRNIKVRAMLADTKVNPGVVS